MAIVYVPYHQDESLADSCIPVRWDAPSYRSSPCSPKEIASTGCERCTTTWPTRLRQK
ncbi:hypothetical protein [Kibdelosporangium philippinense]|uniref:hypothetical protein n=1 Tax=Kibdelosporangium philippinense TaxID=211113 RepID=UPI003610FCE9